MKNIILFELKRSLKSRVFLMAIFFIFVAIAVDMGHANIIKTTRPFGAYPEGLSTNTYEWLIGESETRKDAYPEAVNAYSIYSNTWKMIEITAHKDDYSEYARLNSFKALLTYKMIGVGDTALSEAKAKKDIGELWDKVSDGISFDSITFRPFSRLDSTRLGTYLTVAKFYNHLYEKNLRIEYTDENTSVSVVYRFLDTVLPILVLILGIFFSFNSINKDVTNGAIKLMLTQSVKRKEFYLAKWLSNVLIIIITLFIPIIFVYFIISIVNGNMGLEYPLPYVGNLLTRIIPIANYSATSIDGQPASLAVLGIGHIATSYPMEDIWIYHYDVNFMSFIIYFVFSFILIIFFVSFMVAFIQLLSSLINNVQLCLSISMISLGLFTLISLPFTFGEKINLSPFTLFRPTRILEGLYNITPLTSIIILLISTIILIFIGIRVFNSKEI